MKAPLSFLALIGVMACTSSSPVPDPVIAPAYTGPVGYRCSPADHGGVPNDGKPDTIAIQAAIDACDGTGERTVIPPGVWETGLIRLGSDMEFHLAEGSVLRLVSDIRAFPEVDSTVLPDVQTSVRTAIFGYKVRDLTISGSGRIEGNGQAFWDRDFYNTGLKRPTLPRPEPTLELTGCSNVTVRDITMTDMASFAMRFNLCENVRAEGVTIKNDPRSPNTDGIQVQDTTGALITGVDVRTGDDAIVLKSRRRLTRDVIIENSYVESDDGAVKFGTLSRSGFENIIVRDVTIADSRYGIAIFMIDGGRIANSRFERISMVTGSRHKRTYPIFMDIDRRSAEQNLGEIDGIVFEDIAIRTRGASMITGNPSASIRNITLRNLSIEVLKSPEKLTLESSKPRGNKDLRPLPDSVDYSRTNANFVFGHIQGLVLDNLMIRAEDKGTDRIGMAFSDVTIEGDPIASYTAGGEKRGDLVGPIEP